MGRAEDLEAKGVEEEDEEEEEEASEVEGFNTVVRCSAGRGTVQSSRSREEEAKLAVHVLDGPAS